MTARPRAGILPGMTPPAPPPAVDPLLALSAGEVAAAVNSGDVSAAEVVSAALARIEAHRDGHAFITVCADEAMDRARTNPKGPLAGVPSRRGTYSMRISSRV